MRRWTLTFFAVAVAAIVLGYFLAWATNGFRALDFNLEANIALIAGAILVSALGVGLMALMFYSDSSGRDEEVSSVHRDSQD
ncbi:MAG TPA: hypothetical protein VLX09_14350 [Stellaceae bacterium]|nr:hypothetical protein [Stellaceae bacterium]